MIFLFSRGAAYLKAPQEIKGSDKIASKQEQKGNFLLSAERKQFRPKAKPSGKAKKRQFFLFSRGAAYLKAPFPLRAPKGQREHSPGQRPGSKRQQLLSP
jgi:hypothetical protein